jgi:GT2 family glycosyltransferase
LLSRRSRVARAPQPAEPGVHGASNRALTELLSLPHPPSSVLFLNDDTEPAPGFLEPLIARADERTLVAPRTYLAGRAGVLDDSVGEFDWWRGTWRERTLGRPEAPGDRVARPVGNANLSSLLVPTGAFREAGLLDDAFFVYYDDTDFCRRVANAGYRIWLEPASVVYHRKGATLGGQASAFGCYYLARNRPYLIRKHEGPLRFATFCAYYLATRRPVGALGRTGAATSWRPPGAARDFARGRMGPGPGLNRDGAPQTGLRAERLFLFPSLFAPYSYRVTDERSTCRLGCRARGAPAETAGAEPGRDGAQMGVRQQTVSEWETGRYAPRRDRPPAGDAGGTRAVRLTGGARW